MRKLAVIGDDVYFGGYKVATLYSSGKDLPASIRGEAEHIIRHGPFRPEIERALIDDRDIDRFDHNGRFNLNLGNGQ